MKVLLSIKPEYAEKIFTGKKRFEFRRIIFKNPKVVSVVVYASSPICRVIGEFEIDHIIETELNKLWQQTYKYSGISKKYFFEYFSEKQIGYAIKIKRYLRYKKPLDLKKFFGIKPPQSFVYLKDNTHFIDIYNRANKKKKEPPVHLTTPAISSSFHSSAFG